VGRRAPQRGRGEKQDNCREGHGIGGVKPVTNFEGDVPSEGDLGREKGKELNSAQKGIFRRHRSRRG